MKMPCDDCEGCMNALLCDEYVEYAKGESGKMMFKDWVAKATKKQLQERLLQYNEMWLAFDRFLIDELGEETYMDIAKEFGIKQSAQFLIDMGVSDEEVKEFTESLKSNEPPMA